jgi:hypothetical protein
MPIHDLKIKNNAKLKCYFFSDRTDAKFPDLSDRQDENRKTVVYEDNYSV